MVTLSWVKAASPILSFDGDFQRQQWKVFLIHQLQLLGKQQTEPKYNGR